MNISPTRYIIIWKQSKESENESFTGKEGIQKHLECRAAYGSVVHKKERTQKPYSVLPDLILAKTFALYFYSQSYYLSLWQKCVLVDR